MLIGCDRGIAVFEMLFCGIDETCLIALADVRLILDGKGTGLASENCSLNQVKKRKAKQKMFVNCCSEKRCLFMCIYHVSVGDDLFALSFICCVAGC